MIRSKSDLVVENAILRQQLIVLKRSVKRPKFTTSDRTRLTLLARLTDFWQPALHIVQPDTILRWHRDMFRRYWKWKSTPKSREPRIPRETIELIKQMAHENPGWGTKKIHGEPLKLEIMVDKRTIRKYIKQVRKRSGGQHWRTFLKNHAHEIWACDFTVVHTLFFKPLYVFVVMEHESRRIVHTAVTTNPTDEWTAQQIREATPWGKRPKYLIHDNDGKFGSKFKGLLKDSGIKDIKTPLKAPRANALCERFMGSLQRECTDNFLIFHQHQLHRIVSAYADYFNQQRPHQLDFIQFRWCNR
jgi:transposase InsO family protein